MKRTSGRIVIVTPALADANNGNWQTAWRWRRFLSPLYPVRLVKTWPDADAAGDAAMIALHARRSAASIAAWHARHGGGRLAAVLTGTDLYRDIDVDAAARRSLALASRLIVLQERGPLALPAEFRAKACVIFQSTTTRMTLPKSYRRLRALMVGHLREEKSPETLFAVARLLAGRSDILIDHVGAALDARLGDEARATMAAVGHYRWLDSLPHEATRRRIQRADLLIHASRMEGGAHVVMEAVACGTPVLASRIEGNVGMLGEHYQGYFPCGDAEALADLLGRCRESQPWRYAGSGLLAELADQCRSRVPLFAAAAERDAVRRLGDELLENRPAGWS
ncbi:MAG: TIGR04348 family glycosyltransferase [Rhodocyclaceae bacterium]|nr:TIGR04348 family glycosyltransferase [Rhodocyclaceae bacterium]